MIRLKTSVLLAGALKIGAILGGASDKDAQLLYDFGIKAGLAFQLQDDYLDVYGDPKVFGKNIGGDILCNKKTFMLITALEKQMNRLVSNCRNGWMPKTMNPHGKSRPLPIYIIRLAFGLFAVIRSMNIIRKV